MSRVNSNSHQASKVASPRLTAISARGVGKQYILGGAEQHYDSFRDLLRGALAAPFKKFKTLSGKDKQNLFWALQEVDFDIPEGQVTGVIGRNGAGKSTLLKVLSKITSPTTGQIDIRGRVASLLEVGSGFHPELTGRENIYMNASILGMRRQEVHRKLDDIVQFAEVEKFLDTPVKRYSSGMYVRLAFSVAAHVEPDVLLVDEVLAVGDAKFQQRCIGKLNEVGEQGRTVMFVSHNMGLIQDLCTHTLYLDGGRVSAYGETAQILPQYLRDGVQQEGEWQSELSDSTLQRIYLCDGDSTRTDTFGYQDEIITKIEFVSRRVDSDFVLATRVTDELGRDVFTSWDSDSHARKTKIGEHYQASCTLPRGVMRPGRYFLTVMARNSKHGYLDNIEDASIQFEITNIECAIEQGRFGVVLPTLDWTCQPS